MKVISYQKHTQGGTAIAHFGVSIPAWNMEIRNLTILPSKNGGWYIAMPSYKNRETDKWEKTISFDKTTEGKFLVSARAALEEFAREEGKEIA